MEVKRVAEAYDILCNLHESITDCLIDVLEWYNPDSVNSSYFREMYEHVRDARESLDAAIDDLEEAEAIIHRMNGD